MSASAFTPDTHGTPPNDSCTQAGARLSMSALLLATIADTQHEVRRAGSSRLARWKAQALGCVAVLRLVLVSPFQIGGNMDRLLVTLLLGAAGSGLLVTAFSHTNSGPVQIAPFFLLAVVTPLILRAFRLGGSYRQMFAVCAGVGVIMAVTAYVWVVLDPRSAALRMPLVGHVEGLVILFALVLFGSAIAAKLAWETFAPTRSVFGQVMAALLVGCGAFAVVSFIGGLWYTYARAGWPLSASFAVLEAFYFAVLSVVLVVPPLPRRAAACAESGSLGDPCGGALSAAPRRRSIPVARESGSCGVVESPWLVPQLALPPERYRGLWRRLSLAGALGCCVSTTVSRSNN